MPHGSSSNADSAFRSLEDTFGGRLGYTVEDSHSGYNALRHHLLPYRQQRGANLYRESIGPLTTPRRVIERLLCASDIDVGPLDGYALDLMLRHDPELAKRSGLSRRLTRHRFHFWSQAGNVPTRSWLRCRPRC